MQVSMQTGKRPPRSPYNAVLLNRLVFENLGYSPVRTILSVLAIGVEVTMILTLVGISYVPGKVLALRTSINFPLMLAISSTDHLFILTGARVSAESGIPIFRGVEEL